MCDGGFKNGCILVIVSGCRLMLTQKLETAVVLPVVTGEFLGNWVHMVLPCNANMVPFYTKLSFIDDINLIVGNN